MPVRSHVDYLQLCYFVHLRDHRAPLTDAATVNRNPKIVERFQLLIETNDPFVRCLFNSLIKSDSHSLVSNLMLTQRFRLSNLLQVNHDVILFHICILTSHHAFLIHRIPALLAQLYSHLKSQIHQGPVDALDPRYSFYSLNYNKLLHEHSLAFKAVHLTVHLDSNENLPLRLLHVTCLTCDTISQVKGKVLHQFQVFPPYSTHECELYLIINQSCSSSSSSASSSVPLTRKALLTEVSSHRTMKYSTTIANNDANYLLLNDVDTTSEQISNAIKLNTLKHYGILADGYELRMVLLRRRINSMQNITKDPRRSSRIGQSLDDDRLLLGQAVPHSTLRSSCHHCSAAACRKTNVFKHLPPSPLSSPMTFPFTSPDRTRSTHLLNDLYEEIAIGSDPLYIDNNPGIKARLAKTKSSIDSSLIHLIDALFTNLPQSNNTYLMELIAQQPRLLHIFYAHFLPFLLRNLHCLLDVPVDRCMSSSLDVLAMIFRVACCQHEGPPCSFCQDTMTADVEILVQNCSLVFGKEIQRVQMKYSTTMERCAKKKEETCAYASTDAAVRRNSFSHSFVSIEFIL